MNTDKKNSYETFKCESKRNEKFKKGDTILSLSGNTRLIGLLLEGSARIVSIDENGHESVSDFLHVGDSFGYYIIMPLESVEYIAVAESECTVLFVNFDYVMNSCRRNCENHNELIKKILFFTLQRTQFMSLHINILSQKTLRGKLMVYFNYLRLNSENSNEILVPVTFDKLSGYLGSDRSALMREIRRMNDDGIIRSNGKKITLLYDRSLISEYKV